MAVDSGWPPKVEELSVQQVVNALQGALQGDEAAAWEVLEALDREEVREGEIVVKVPGRLWLAPTKVGTEWTDFEYALGEAR